MLANPWPADVVGVGGRPVGVDERGAVSGEPERFRPEPRGGVAAGRGLGRPVAGRGAVVGERIIGRPRRVARFQVVGVDGRAWLMTWEDGSGAPKLRTTDGRLMGWSNPAISWGELEKRLSGRRQHAAGPRGADLDRASASANGSRSSDPPDPVTPYAELHCHSNFSFLDGASGPDHLVLEAIRLGLHALAITDHDGFYGAPLFAETAQLHSVDGQGIQTIYGAELSLGLSGPQNGVPDPEGSHLLVLARGVEGYHRLAGAITDAQLRGDEKGRPVYDLAELAERGRDHWLVLTGCRKGAVRQAPGGAVRRTPPRSWTG